MQNTGMCKNSSAVFMTNNMLGCVAGHGGRGG